MARPSKLNGEVKERLVRALAIGTTHELACGYAGVSTRSLQRWLKEGREAKSGAAAELFKEIARAEGEAMVGWMAVIERAARDGDWRAAAWKAERRWPQFYGRQVVEQAGRLEQEMNVRITYTNDWRSPAALRGKEGNSDDDWTAGRS
jgi:hypothetical protein